jgi:hypothetical protein
MIGAIIITYFIADTQSRSTIESLTTQYTEDLVTIEENNINFTNRFIKSSVILDTSREYRAFGDYHFDLAFLWYNTALLEDDNETMHIYKSRCIENCSYAMPNYKYSYDNFFEAKKSFFLTKTFTYHDKYQEILNLYVNLTDSGQRLTLLRYNASQYLMYLAENLTMSEDGTVTYLTNVSRFIGLFEETMMKYEEESEKFEEIKDAIDEYEFFEEIRE